MTAGALVDHVAVRPLVNAQAVVYLVAGILAAAVSWRRRPGARPVPVAIVAADRE